MKYKGFTLIELLVVISIIGLLAAAGLATYTSAINKARYTKAKSELDELRKAMIMYRLDVGELPPPGDNCSACSNPPNSTWTLAITSLINAGYLSERIDRDPWENYYGYDDNDCNSNPGVSYIFTAGADKVSWTADDYRIDVTNGCAY